MMYNNVVYFNTYGDSKCTHSIIFTFILTCAFAQHPPTPSSENRSERAAALKMKFAAHTKFSQTIFIHNRMMSYALCWNTTVTICRHHHHHPYHHRPSYAVWIVIIFSRFSIRTLTHSLAARSLVQLVRLHRCRGSVLVFCKNVTKYAPKGFIYFLQCHSENGIRMKISCISGVLILDKIYKLLHAKLFIATPAQSLYLHTLCLQSVCMCVCVHSDKGMV